MNYNLELFFINFRTNRERGAINPKARNMSTDLKIIEVNRDKTKKPIISGKYLFRFKKQYKKLIFYQLFKRKNC